MGTARSVCHPPLWLRVGEGRGPLTSAREGQGRLHVVEPELLLHVARGHLPKRLLVVLHELEDGSQLLLLHSVGKRGQRGKGCSEPGVGGRHLRPGLGPRALGCCRVCFPGQEENQTEAKPTQNPRARVAERPQLEGSKSRLYVLGVPCGSGEDPSDPVGSPRAPF